MKLRQSAQQALEALERYQVKRQDFDRFADEITALRTALLIDVTHAQMAHADSLAEPEKEPVAWIAANGTLLNAVTDPGLFTPLYTAPTPQKPQTTHWEGCEAVHPGCRATPRQWVGLTDEEIDVGLCRSPYALQAAQAWRDGVEWAQEQLKEKNT